MEEKIVSYIKGRIQAKSIWKLEANIWIQEGWEWGVEKASQWGTSSNIIRVINYEILKWTGHIASIEEGRSALKNVAGEHSRREI